ncbi:thioredoxin-like protein [Cladochytrium replicatum]|nr:thioredoxin-like protein [Cladochytrium replicatum]
MCTVRQKLLVLALLVLAFLGPHIARGASIGITNADYDSQIQQLNNDDFDEKIKTGTWLVFFGAKTCPHCRQLTPKWLEAQNWIADTVAPKKFFMAKVECTKNENLCESQQLVGYPTLKLFHNGAYVEEYLGSLDVEAMVTYISNKASYYNPATSRTSTTSEANLNISSGVYTDPSKFAAASVSAEVAHLSAWASKFIETKENVNPTGEVVALTDASFDKTTVVKPWFVMFHAPWCPHCQHLAPIWEQLGSSVKGRVNIGKVDCTRETKLCKEHDIRGYPTLKFFDESGVIDFDGQRALDELVEFASQLTTITPFSAIDGASYTAMAASNPTAFFYIYDPATTLRSAVDSMIKVALSVRSKTTFFLAPTSGYPAPSLLRTVDTGRFTHRYAFPLELTPESRQAANKWILRHRFPLTFEVSSDNGDEIMSGERVVVLGIVDEKGVDRMRSVLSEAARKWIEFNNPMHTGGAQGSLQLESNEVLFGWIRADLWGTFLSSTYGISSSAAPMLIIADPKVELFYDADSLGKAFIIDAEAIPGYINMATRGVLKGKSSAGFIKRMGLQIHDTVAPVWQIMQAHSFVLILLAVVCGYMSCSLYSAWKGSNNNPYSRVPKAD